MVRVRRLMLVAAAFLTAGSLAACGSDAPKGTAAPTPTTSAGASATTSPAKPTSNDYAGTLTSTSSQGSHKTPLTIGIACYDRCNLTGWSAGQDVVVLTPVSTGRYRVDMPAGPPDCSRSFAGEPALAGDVIVNGSTMTFTLKTPGTKQCGITVYAMTYAFSGSQA